MIPSPRLVTELGHALLRNRIRDMAAQLAFWSLLALFPFCIFLLTIVGYLPLVGVDRELLSLLAAIMPTDAAKVFVSTLYEIVGRQHGVLLVVSLGGALWSASGGMGTAAHALNLAWQVDERRPWLRRRLTYLAVTLGVALLTIVATVGLLVGPGVVQAVWEVFSLGRVFHRIWPWLRWPVIALDLLVLLACLYHFLPSQRPRFRLISPGALVAVAVWALGSAAFRSYVAHVHSFARTYGTLGGAVILLVWLYLSAFTLILGGEIDAALARASRPEPLPSPPATNSS